ncbi:MAG: Rrf2 family transcriptional regulator [Phenylobacterium sp.]|nr:Rrf2 family transcriptional regulator [Phenylobacterium sp.]
MDSRLSGVLHVLLHMAEQDAPVTSEVLAIAMNANPAAVRRTMAGLRDQGFVSSAKGHGGGWVLARDLSDISLLDIYRALGAPRLLALGHRSDAPDCLVEQVVNHALDTAFREAEAVLLARLGDVSLATLSRDFHTLFADRPRAQVSHDPHD